MLSFDKVVAKAKPYLEYMYQDTCTIIERHKVTNDDGSKGFEEVTVQEDIPCRLSFQSNQIAGETQSASQLVQDIEVFMSNEISVKAGSKLIITHLGESTEYKSTGEPAIYNNHQELSLEIFKGWV